MVGLDRAIYVGNHGADLLAGAALRRAPSVERAAARITETLAQLESRLRLPGLRIEDKGATGAVHYRQAPAPAVARRMILESLASIPAADGLVIQEGRLVVNLLPSNAPTKGSAVLDLCARFDLRGAVYLGDDRTDMAAFEALRAWRRETRRRALAIGVLSPEGPAGLAESADVTLDGTGDVEAFLVALANSGGREPNRC